jgi:hypothetical protein
VDGREKANPRLGRLCHGLAAWWRSVLALLVTGARIGGSLFALLLFAHVMADRAASRGAQDTMATGDVARNAANDGALEAAGAGDRRD